MNLIEVLNFNHERELIRADQIESIGLPLANKLTSERFVHGWVMLISGRSIGFAPGEADRFIAEVRLLSNKPSPDLWQVI